MINSTPAPTRRLTHLFLALLLIDGLLAAGSGVVPTLGTIHPFVAWPTAFLAAVLYCGLALTRRLVARILLPAIFFSIWVTVCGAFPFRIEDPTAGTVWVGIAQTLLASVLLAFTLDRPMTHRIPGFAWRRFAIFAALAILLIPAALGIASLNLFAVGINESTSGYARLRPDGIYLEERRFSRDNKEVRLVGMIHVARNGFFDSVAESFAGSGPAIVLTEGVTDEGNLLEHGFSYAGLAELLGAIPQESARLTPAGRYPAGFEDDYETERSGVRYRRADVDIGSFSPETIAILNSLGAFLADPSNPASLSELRGPDSPLRRPDAQDKLLGDIVTNRNAHLLEQIDEALDSANLVIVPWGAMHLPEIELHLLANGFTEKARTPRAAFLFWQ
ncbi:MAG: hypothetical protein WA771_01670 [Chthoniobacterales bacterium]